MKPGAVTCSICEKPLCPHGAYRITSGGLQVCAYCDKSPESYHLNLPMDRNNPEGSPWTSRRVCKSCYQKKKPHHDPEGEREVLRQCKELFRQYTEGEISCEELDFRAGELLRDVLGGHSEPDREHCEGDKRHEDH